MSVYWYGAYLEVERVESAIASTELVKLAVGFLSRLCINGSNVLCVLADQSETRVSVIAHFGHSILCDSTQKTREKCLEKVLRLPLGVTRVHGIELLIEGGENPQAMLDTYSYPISLGSPRARRVDLILCNFTENPHLPHGRLFVGKAPEVTAERGCARNIVL
jgi:hypothetical protein